MNAGRGSSLVDASGSSPLRASVWLWHVPSVLFVAAAAVVSLLIDNAPIGIGWVVVAAAVIVLASAVAVLAQRQAEGHAIEAAVPVLLLFAAGVIHGSSQGALHSTILLAGLPVAWLAFTFGAVGTIVAIAATMAIAASPYASSTWPTTSLERWDTILPAAALVGMACVTYGAGRLLARVQGAVMTRTIALQREISTTRAVVASADAAIAVFVTHEAPQLSPEAVEMCRRAGATRLDVTAADAFVGVDVHDADRETSTTAEAQAMVRASRGETYSDLVQWVGTGDDRRAMVCSSNRIVGTSGDAVGTVFVAWDATELLDSVRVREEFLGTVGHELRTPLTAITGYLELYAEDAVLSPSPGDDYVKAAKRQVTALGDRIEDLLAAAAPRRIWTTAVDVVPSVRALVSAHQADARRGGLELRLVTPDELIADINPGAFGEILRNLLSNAFNHTQQGSVVVTLEALDPAEDCEAPRGFSLTIADTGIGMSDREAQRVFDRFYRTEATIRRVVPGLGVGLTVTRQLVLAHRGTITVQSAPNEGTRFRVTIPSARSAAPST